MCVCWARWGRVFAELGGTGTQEREGDADSCTSAVSPGHWGVIPDTLTSPEGKTREGGFCSALTDVVGTVAWRVWPQPDPPRGQGRSATGAHRALHLPAAHPGRAVGSVAWAQLSPIIPYSLQERNHREQNSAVVTRGHFMVMFFWPLKFFNEFFLFGAVLYLTIRLVVFCHSPFSLWLPRLLYKLGFNMS